MEPLLTADGLIALVTLTVLEVVLGIDNVIFISILAGKLPKERRRQARRIGLMGAMGMRILLLMSIAWIDRGSRRRCSRSSSSTGRSPAAT